MITLKTLHLASSQKVFDQCANHLLTQNKKSEENGSCVYKTNDGLKCAAGCFMSDEEYKTDFEGNSFCSISFHGSYKYEKHTDLINKLQIIHDNCDVSVWKDRLHSLAVSNNLNTYVLANY